MINLEKKGIRLFSFIRGEILKIEKVNLKDVILPDYNPRLHHVIDWEHCVPKIISDRYKKRGDKIGEKIKANSRTY